jgi:hypothetical protein
MLVIFAFFSIISTVLVASAAVAVLNVVIRRENANLIQERINGVDDSCNRFAKYALTVLLNEKQCSMSVLVRVRLTESFLNRLSTQAGLEISGNKIVPMRRYRADRGLAGEIEANFVPGSGQPVPILVNARNWQTGQFEDWTVCQLRPTYAPTIEGLNRMGLRHPGSRRSVVLRLGLFSFTEQACFSPFEVHLLAEYL